jgi:hypothetical protein
MKLRHLSALVATTALVATLSVPSGASTTPYAQMKTVIADLKAEHAARVTATLTMSGKRLVNTTNAASIGGYQTIVLTDSGKSNTVIIELLDNGGLYVKGDAAILIAYMGFSKTTSRQLSNQWFTIPKDNSDYAEVSQGLTLSSIATELTMNKSVTSPPSGGSISGIPVTVLKGSSVKSALEPSSNETLYVTKTASPLPVEALQSYQGSKSTIVFGHWNETVTLTVPRAKFQLN